MHDDCRDTGHDKGRDKGRDTGVDPGIDTRAGRTRPASDACGHARPRSAPQETVAGAVGERPGRYPDPTRYGDWEKDGRCIDF